MKVYDVVVANSPEELAKKVNDKMEQGYAPFGNISISTVVEKYNTLTTTYVQAVALIPDEECHCSCKEEKKEEPKEETPAEPEKEFLVEPVNATKKTKKK